MTKAKKVTLWTSEVVHIIDLDRPRFPDEVDERRAALCGFKPLWPGEWAEVPEDSDEERPVCVKCDYIFKGVSGERKP